MVPETPLTLSMAKARPALVTIHIATSLVRKVLFSSSMVGFSRTSFISILVIARVTVSLKFASTSA